MNDTWKITGAVSANGALAMVQGVAESPFPWLMLLQGLVAFVTIGYVIMKSWSVWLDIKRKRKEQNHADDS